MRRLQVQSAENIFFTRHSLNTPIKIPIVFSIISKFLSFVIRKSDYLLKPTFEPPHDKTNKMTGRPVKTQISLGVRPVWSESSLSAWRNIGSLVTHWAHSEDSDQTGRMPRLIWAFAGRTATLSVLSCRGSFLQLILTMMSVEINKQEKLHRRHFIIVKHIWWVSDDNRGIIFYCSPHKHILCVLIRIASWRRF